jgi:hypothetical protein
VHWLRGEYPSLRLDIRRVIAGRRHGRHPLPPRSGAW